MRRCRASAHRASTAVPVIQLRPHTVRHGWYSAHRLDHCYIRCCHAMGIPDVNIAYGGTGIRRSPRPVVRLGPCGVGPFVTGAGTVALPNGWGATPPPSAVAPACDSAWGGVRVLKPINMIYFLS